MPASAQPGRSCRGRQKLPGRICRGRRPPAPVRTCRAGQDLPGSFVAPTRRLLLKPLIFKGSDPGPGVAGRGRMMVAISQATAAPPTLPDAARAGEGGESFSSLLAALLGDAAPEPPPDPAGEAATEQAPEARLAEEPGEAIGRPGPAEPDAPAVPSALLPLAMVFAEPVDGQAAGATELGPAKEAEAEENQAQPLRLDPVSDPALPVAPPATAAPAASQQAKAAEAISGRAGVTPEARPSDALANDPAGAPPASLEPDADADRAPETAGDIQPERLAAPTRVRDRGESPPKEQPIPETARGQARGAVEPSPQLTNRTAAPTANALAGAAPTAASEAEATPSPIASGEAAARPAERPVAPPPPPLVQIAVHRAAEPRPLRAAAPALSPLVAAASVETLNAAQPPAEPAPLTAQALEAPGAGPPGSTDALTDDAPVAEGGAALLRSSTPSPSSPRPEVNAAPVRRPSEANTTPPGSATATSTGQPLAQPALGLAGLPITSPPAPQAQTVQWAPRAAPAQQIMPVVVTLAAGSSASPGSVTVTLEPVELGRVEISVRSENEQQARIHIVAERPETLLLLVRDQAALDRALAQAGVGAEGRAFSFDLAARDGRGGGEAPAREGGDGRGSAPANARADAERARSETVQRRAAPGGLDIAV